MQINRIERGDLKIFQERQTYEVKSWSHTPIDVDSYPFSFDQMRDQLDGIQQDNSNYDESMSSYSK